MPNIEPKMQWLQSGEANNELHTLFNVNYYTVYAYVVDTLGATQPGVKLNSQNIQ